jgi:hypothetical protein
MAKRALTLNVRIDGLRETLAAFNAMPKEANDELRAASLEIAGELADGVRQRAQGESRQAALIAGTVKARRDRVPSVSAGGSGNLTPIHHNGRKPAKAYQILFGSEFGAHGDWRFKPFRSTGYWFYPAVNAYRDKMAEKWRRAVDKILARWGGE